MYDIVPSVPVTQHHLIGSLPMHYTVPIFTLTHTQGLTAAQQVFTYSLV